MQPYDDGFSRDFDRASWRHRRRFSVPPELSVMLGCTYPALPPASDARDADERRRELSRTMSVAMRIALEIALALHQRRRDD